MIASPTIFKREPLQLAAKRREKNKTWFTRLMCLFKKEKTHVIF
ncbi:hypothetical protein Rin_00021270 [Candidatus Regiella insecticola 5.15]|uniref:Uncharacterized protein n=1 Tax=Candidatus Regiella insecticola 5.15 TaxID=1005043 RepID=G2H230_9ENTR|nr:hypothetical protein Rin_00021270 [Candidatus Regiella insecticola 5.15]